MRRPAKRDLFAIPRILRDEISLLLPFSQFPISSFCFLVFLFPPRPKPISAKEVRLIRRALNASQSLFAGYLNVSPNAVRS